MSRELGPVAASLEMLQVYLAQGCTGSFYLVDVDDNVATIVLASGVVETVSFHGRHGDFAVELLKSVKTASSNFRPGGAARAASESELSRRASRWLAGQPTGAAHRAPPASVPVLPPRPSLERYRGVVEAACFAYFGPIAGVVCDGALTGAADLNAVIDQLAARLTAEEGRSLRLALARSIDQAALADGSAAGGRGKRARRVVERIAYAFLGPIAGVVCDRAFADGRDLAQAVDEIAANLTPAKAASLRDEIAKATAVS